MPDKQQISRATDLAEQLLGEVIRPHQDWAAVKRLAVTLAELADALAQTDPGSRSPKSPG